jgi:nucleoside-diphosphate-sugar epimerase
MELIPVQINWDNPEMALDFVFKHENFQGLKAFFHCASDISYSISGYESSHKLNVLSNVRFLTALNSYKDILTETFTYNYISTIYSAGFTKGKVTENLNPIGGGSSAYWLTKNIAERIVHEFSNKFKIKSNVVRPSGITGHSQTGWLCEQNKGYASTVEQLAKMAQMGVKKINFNYNMDTARADLIPIDYLVDWISAAAKRNSNSVFEIFNLSFSKQPFTYLDVFKGLGQPFDIEMAIGAPQNKVDVMVNESKAIKSITDYLDNYWGIDVEKIKGLQITKFEADCDLVEVMKNMSKNWLKDHDR